jgi:serine/threonine protein kinase
MEKDLDFATLAIAHRVLTREQLEEAERTIEKEVDSGKPRRPVEDVLLEKGILRSEQVWAVFKAKERLMRDARARGQRIGGYEIIAKIGEGGLGVVYKARQLSMGRVVALKVLHERWVTDDEFRKRFLVEARLAGRLSHPNLIQVIDVGRYRNTLYFSMEFVDGEPVDATLDREGRMDLRSTVAIAIQMAGALEYLHQRRIVHRDVKPGNIMVTRSGIAKLGDFGFVKSSLESVLSTEGEVLGTPDYISPEAAKGEKNLDFRSDLYSFGATLYHMLSGSPPFGGSVSDVMEQHIKSEPRPLASLVKGIPGRVIDIVDKLMRKKPEDRFQNFSELIAELEAVRVAAKGENLPAGTATRTSIARDAKDGAAAVPAALRGGEEFELRKTISRLKTAAIWLGAGLAAAIAVIVYLVFFQKPPGS